MPIAYLIAINDYHPNRGIEALRTPIADAQHLAEVLEKVYAYEIHLFDKEITLIKFREILIEIQEIDSPQDDSFLFYFAGHGLARDHNFVGPGGYLIPEDAEYNKPETWLPMQELYAAMAQRNPHHLLLILDCCFSGNFRWSSPTRDFASLGTLYLEQYQYFKQHKAWQVLTSSAYDEQVLDLIPGKWAREGRMEGKHSPFAHVLCKGLEGKADLIPEGGDGIITATELYLYVLKTFVSLQQDSHLKQTPGLWPMAEHQKGEFIFSYKKAELPLAPPLAAQNNPYLGLRAYEKKDAHLFFGRKEEAKELYTAIVNHPFVMLLGNSGSGKSSLVKAKLIPNLLDHPQSRWEVLPAMRPGNDPMNSLESVLIRANVLDKGTEIVEAIKHWLSAHPQKTLFLVIDQFEELITQTRSWEDSQRFMECLSTLLSTHHARLKILVTLRLDFEPHFSEGELKPFWQDRHRFILGPMGIQAMKAVIGRPAALQGIFFDPLDLPDHIIESLIDAPGALPLLSFTLSELYLEIIKKGEKNRTISITDFQKLKGVTGAIIKKADRVYDELPSESHQRNMQKIMLRMVSIEGGEFARKGIFEAELDFGDDEENKQIELIVKRLVASRLIVKSVRNEQSYLEPAHDELVRSWPKLARWVLAIGRENLQLLQQINIAAKNWKRGDGGLWVDDPKINLVLDRMGEQIQEQSLTKVFLGWLRARFKALVN